VNKKQSKFEVYRDKAKEWRWRFVAGNGQVTAGPEEGYKRKSACMASILRHKAAVWGAAVVEAPEPPTSPAGDDVAGNWIVDIGKLSSFRGKKGKK